MTSTLSKCIHVLVFVMFFFCRKCNLENKKQVCGESAAVPGHSADVRSAQGRHAHAGHLQGPQGGETGWHRND